MTVGWLFSEVAWQYHKYVEYVNKNGVKVAKRMMVSLKTIEGISTMDYYLTMMENTLQGIPDGIEFAIHFAKSYDKDEIVTAYEEAIEEGKDASSVTIDDFELLKLIGKGGYSQVFMARKKDSG